MTVTTFTGSTNGKRMSRIQPTGGGYPNVHDNATADFVLDALMANNALDTGNYNVARAGIILNTAILAGKILDSAKLELYCQAKGIDGTVQIVNGQPTYPHSPVVVGDFLYNQYSGNGGSASYAGWITSGYNNINLNATGLTWINKTGITKLCIKQLDDINNVTPTTLMYVFLGDATVSGQEPKLEVTYHDAPPNRPKSSNASKLYAIDILFQPRKIMRWNR